MASGRDSSLYSKAPILIVWWVEGIFSSEEIVV